jgi:hypothetical protein
MVVAVMFGTRILCHVLPPSLVRTMIGFAFAQNPQPVAIHPWSASRKSMDVAPAPTTPRGEGEDRDPPGGALGAAASPNGAEGLRDAFPLKPPTAAVIRSPTITTARIAAAVHSRRFR